MGKMLGAILILLGCGGLGYLYTENEEKKIRFIRMWEDVLELFISEVSYKKESLGIAGEKIGKRIGGKEGECFCRISKRIQQQEGEGFARIWKEEWERYFKTEKIGCQERRIIREFASVTGFEDEKLQIKMIQEQKEKWIRIRIDIMKELEERKRLVWILSVSMASIIILILI